MTAKEHLLIVEDEEHMRVALRAALLPVYDISVARHGAEALQMLGESECMAVITDLAMPGLDGLQLLQEVKRRYPQTDVIIITAYGAVKSAVEAMRLGAFDYLTKPFEVDELHMVLERIAGLRRMKREIEYLRGELFAAYEFESIVGRSAPMASVFDIIRKTIRSDYPLLITGESGTGKELVARVYHFNGPRCRRPFMAINCSTLSAELMESELFGHVKGAFSGAIRDKPGLFEVADGGTLFLDEVGEMPPNLQARLLRVLEDGEIRRVGGTTTTKVDVRLISATNRDLDDEVRQGRFRRDLYYRLNLLIVHLPALRDRTGDIPLLAHHFLRRVESRVTAIAPEAMQMLERYPWPGNVRELENVLKRACLLAGGELLQIADLPEHVRARFAPDPVHLSLEEHTRAYMLEVLGACKGNISDAARVLGLPRSTLRSKLKAHGIDEISR